MQLKPRVAVGVAAEPRLPEVSRPLPPITMGIKGLTKLLSDHAAGCAAENTLGTYFGRKIAIDASMSIYQFLIVIGRKGTTTLMNEAGGDTSHLQGMLTRTTRLIAAGIKPLYVFDGNPPELKKKELLKRSSRREAAVADLSAALENGDNAEIEKHSKRMIRVTKQHSEDCRRLLQLIGVPAIQAPGEAEAECATLCKSGKVYAVSSEDMDSLTFGAPKFLRHLMDPTSRKLPVLEFDLQKVLHLLNLTMDQFIDLCILCGCDYCETIKGIGPQTALKLIRQHGRLEDVLENINKDRYKVPDSWPFQETRQLFKNPVVSTVQDLPEIHWAGPDEQGLRRFLVDENNFNYERVLKAIEKIKAVNIQQL